MGSNNIGNYLQVMASKIGAPRARMPPYPGSNFESMKEIYDILEENRRYLLPFLIPTDPDYELLRKPFPTGDQIFRRCLRNEGVDVKQRRRIVRKSTRADQSEGKSPPIESDSDRLSQIVDNDVKTNFTCFNLGSPCSSEVNSMSEFSDVKSELGANLGTIKIEPENDYPMNYCCEFQADISPSIAGLFLVPESVTTTSETSIIRDPGNMISEELVIASADTVSSLHSPVDCCMNEPFGGTEANGSVHVPVEKIRFADSSSDITKVDDACKKCTKTKDVPVENTTIPELSSRSEIADTCGEITPTENVFIEKTCIPDSSATTEIVESFSVGKTGSDSSIVTETLEDREFTETENGTAEKVYVLDTLAVTDNPGACKEVIEREVAVVSLPESRYTDEGECTDSNSTGFGVIEGGFQVMACEHLLQHTNDNSIDSITNLPLGNEDNFTTEVAAPTGTIENKSKVISPSVARFVGPVENEPTSTVETEGGFNAELTTAPVNNWEMGSQHAVVNEKLMGFDHVSVCKSSGDNTINEPAREDCITPSTDPQAEDIDDYSEADDVADSMFSTGSAPSDINDASDCDIIEDMTDGFLDITNQKVSTVPLVYGEKDSALGPTNDSHAVKNPAVPIAPLNTSDKNPEPRDSHESSFFQIVEVIGSAHDIHVSESNASGVPVPEPNFDAAFSCPDLDEFLSEMDPYIPIQHQPENMSRLSEKPFEKHSDNNGDIFPEVRLSDGDGNCVEGGGKGKEMKLPKVSSAKTKVPVQEQFKIKRSAMSPKTPLAEKSIRCGKPPKLKSRKAIIAGPRGSKYVRSRGKELELPGSLALFTAGKIQKGRLSRKKKIGLVVYPGCDKPLHPVARLHLYHLRSNKTVIDPMWARFAAATVVTENEKNRDRMIIPALCPVRVTGDECIIDQFVTSSYYKELNVKESTKTIDSEIKNVVYGLLDRIEETPAHRECFISLNQMTIRNVVPWCMNHQLYACQKCGLDSGFHAQPLREKCKNEPSKNVLKRPEPSDAYEVPAKKNRPDLKTSHTDPRKKLSVLLPQGAPADIPSRKGTILSIIPPPFPPDVYEKSVRIVALGGRPNHDELSILRPPILGDIKLVSYNTLREYFISEYIEVYFAAERIFVTKPGTSLDFATNLRSQTDIPRSVRKVFYVGHSHGIMAVMYSWGYFWELCHEMAIGNAGESDKTHDRLSLSRKFYGNVSFTKNRTGLSWLLLSLDHMFDDIRLTFEDDEWRVPVAVVSTDKQFIKCPVRRQKEFHDELGIYKIKDRSIFVAIGPYFNRKHNVHVYLGDKEVTLYPHNVASVCGDPVQGRKLLPMVKQSMNHLLAGGYQATAIWLDAVTPMRLYLKYQIANIKPHKRSVEYLVSNIPSLGYFTTEQRNGVRWIDDPTTPNHRMIFKHPSALNNFVRDHVEHCQELDIQWRAYPSGVHLPNVKPFGLRSPKSPQAENEIIDIVRESRLLQQAMGCNQSSISLGTVVNNGVACIKMLEAEGEAISRKMRGLNLRIAQKLARRRKLVQMVGRFHTVPEDQIPKIQTADSSSRLEQSAPLKSVVHDVPPLSTQGDSCEVVVKQPPQAASGGIKVKASQNKLIEIGESRVVITHNERATRQMPPPSTSLSDSELKKLLQGNMSERVSLKVPEREEKAARQMPPPSTSPSDSELKRDFQGKMRSERVLMNVAGLQAGGDLQRKMSQDPRRVSLLVSGIKSDSHVGEIRRERFPVKAVSDIRTETKPEGHPSKMNEVPLYRYRHGTKPDVAVIERKKLCLLRSEQGERLGTDRVGKLLSSTQNSVDATALESVPRYRYFGTVAKNASGESLLRPSTTKDQVLPKMEPPTSASFTNMRRLPTSIQGLKQFKLVGRNESGKLLVTCKKSQRFIPVVIPSGLRTPPSAASVALASSELRTVASENSQLSPSSAEPCPTSSPESIDLIRVEHTYSSPKKEEEGKESRSKPPTVSAYATAAARSVLRANLADEVVPPSGEKASKSQNSSVRKLNVEAGSFINISELLSTEGHGDMTLTVEPIETLETPTQQEKGRSSSRNVAASSQSTISEERLSLSDHPTIYIPAHIEQMSPNSYENAADHPFIRKEPLSRVRLYEDRINSIHAQEPMVTSECPDPSLDETSCEVSPNCTQEANNLVPSPSNQPSVDKNMLREDSVSCAEQTKNGLSGNIKGLVSQLPLDQEVLHKFSAAKNQVADGQGPSSQLSLDKALQEILTSGAQDARSDVSGLQASESHDSPCRDISIVEIFEKPKPVIARRRIKYTPRRDELCRKKDSL